MNKSKRKPLTAWVHVHEYRGVLLALGAAIVEKVAL